MLAMEGLGYGCRDNGLTFGLNAQLWTVQLPIVGSERTSRSVAFCPTSVRATRIGAHAITEADAGSDVFSLRHSRDALPGGYRAQRTKRLITLRARRGRGWSSPPSHRSGAMGDHGVPGGARTRPASLEPRREKMGLRTVPIGELTFEDCFVPEGSRLGPEGPVRASRRHSLEIERCCILASQLGRDGATARRRGTLRKERRQFGQPIGKFQAVSHRIAEMKLRLETARLLLYKVAWLKKRRTSPP
jgi:alkylation response protein AidB-like acyl-CoA dehydrogenase